MEYSAQTHTGLKRKGKANEDYMAVYTAAEGAEIFLLADGMGGMSKGEVASKMAVETFLEHIRKNRQHLADGIGKFAYQEIKEMLKKGFAVANEAVFTYARQDAESRGMGTTLICSFVQTDRLILGNIGDSRAYLHRQQELSQITKDHSYVQELVDRGELTPGEALYNRQKNIITRAVGTEETVKVDLFELELEMGDKLLLCTDGLSNMVPDSYIRQVFNSTAHPQEAVTALLKKALDNGGLDNITLFCIFI